MDWFTQNSDLKRAGIWAWTLPAHVVKLSTGETFNTCPNAGICAGFCYAKTERWVFPTVRRAHVRKLEQVLNRLEWFAPIINAELKRDRYAKDCFVRVHDGGDFFNKTYAIEWMKIARLHPLKTFYSYTKEVSLFRRLRADRCIPKNFVVIFSFGGKEDHLIDREKDRNSDVFPDWESMDRAGYFRLGGNDSLAATHQNNKIGLIRNNISHLVKKMGERSFSQWSSGNKRVELPTVGAET